MVLAPGPLEDRATTSDAAEGGLKLAVIMPPRSVDFCHQLRPVFHFAGPIRRGKCEHRSNMPFPGGDRTASGAGRNCHAMGLARMNPAGGRLEG